MKKNIKGTTLIEIMISVALIAIVMIFMFNLLVELKVEDSLSTSKSEDALNRSAIIRIIQNDLITKKLAGLKQCDNFNGKWIMNNNSLCIHFSFTNGNQKELQIFEKKLVYDNEVWTLKSGNYELDKLNYSFITTQNNQAKCPSYFLKIIIPVTHDIDSRRKYDFEIVNVDSITNITNVNGAFTIPETLQQ